MRTVLGSGPREGQGAWTVKGIGATLGGGHCRCKTDECWAPFGATWKAPEDALNLLPMGAARPAVIQIRLPQGGHV